jgi:cytochrome c oxidase subunit 2
LALWGQQVAHSAGCFGCHTIDGASSDGPTFLGLYGQTRTLDDGSIAVADDAYLHESIVEPSAKRVAGFPDIMDQDYAYRLSEEDIRAIIAYIKTLR